MKWQLLILLLKIYAYLNLYSLDLSTGISHLGLTHLPCVNFLLFLFKIDSDAVLRNIIHVLPV